MDLEEAGRGGGRLLAFRNHLANRGLLLRGERGAAAPHAPFLPGGLDAGLGAFPQHGALELREGPHHVHQHPAGRRRRVDRLGHAPESRAGVPELRHEREHVAQRAREPIQLPHHNNVPVAQVREELEELGPIPPSAGRLLTKDALAPRRGQRRHLRRGVLIVGGHAGVPDQHCRTVSPIPLIRQYRFATPKPLQTRPGPEGCTTVPFCNISGDPKCLSSPPTRRRAVVLALNRPRGPVGDKENGPFQFTFNGLLKLAFQGSHITSDAGLILVRELNERLGLEHRITDHLSDSRHGTNTQFRVADLLRQSVYSRLAGYENLNDAVGAFSEERWRRKSTGMERCPRNAVEPRRFPSIPRRGVYRFCVPGAGRSATKTLVATGARWCSVGLFRTAKMEIQA